MKFAKIIGNIDPDKVISVEKKIEAVFLDLGLSPDPAKKLGTGLGGCPLHFSLVVPAQHILTNNVPNAATNGKVFYWNPDFVLAKSIIGLRLVVAHESFHALYMHPDRIGSRNRKIWNIAADYVVNHLVMDDLLFRRYDPSALFRKELGDFLTLKQLEEWCKNPNWLPYASQTILPDLELPNPEENRELTAQEKENLQHRQKTVKFFFADPNLLEKYRSPEKLYQYLSDLFKQYPQAGNLVMGNSDTLDHHIDAEATQEEMAKHLARAIEMSKRMAGTVPAALEQELGLLLQPKIRWQDVIKFQMLRTRDGNQRSDWTRFRSRPLFAGLLVPKKVDYRAKFIVLLDTSASMHQDETILGISQLQSLDERAEGKITFCDTKVAWDKTIELKRFDCGSLQNIKPRGGGGTQLASFFNEYQKNLGAADFLIVITDGGLDAADIKKMRTPSIPTYWLQVADTDFTAPFGKVFKLTE